MQKQLISLSRAALFGALTAVTFSSASATTTSATSTTAPRFGQTEVAAGTPIAVSAAVTASNGQPVTVGRVDFCIEGTENRKLLSSPCGPFPLASAQVMKNGMAVSSIRLPIGSMRVVAVFTGTHSLKGSVSPSTVATVKGLYATSTSLSYTGPASNLTLKATVTVPSSFIPGYLSVRNLTNRQPLFSFPGQVTSTYSFNSLGSSQKESQVQPLNVVTADINNDGYPDIVSLGSSINDNPPGKARLAINQGGKGFGPLVDGPLPTPSTGFSGYAALGVGDLNSDDISDLVLFNSDEGTIDVFYGTGNGTFPASPSVTVSASGLNPSLGNIYVADFNEDGRQDIAFSTQDAFFVYPNQGGGVFGEPIKTDIPANSSAVALLTQTHSGHINVALTLGSGWTGQEGSEILLGNGDGTFTGGPTFPQSVQLSSYTPEAAALDLNGDGYQDLVLGTATNSPVILLSTSTGYTLGKSPALSHPIYNVLATAEGVLLTDQLGNFTFLQPSATQKYPLTNFIVPTNDPYEDGSYPSEALLTAGDFNASGLTGFLLATGGQTNSFYGFFNGLQPFSAFASSTMTIQQSGFSYLEPQTVLGLYHPGGNRAFVSSDSPDVTVPGTKK